MQNSNEWGEEGLPTKETLQLKEELEECKRELSVYRNRIEIYEAAEPELWIFTRKRTLMDMLLNYPVEQLRNLPDQEWYAEYLALLRISLEHDGLWHLGQNFCQQMIQLYHELEADTRKHMIVLAMLLYMKPLDLPVPIEVHLWPQKLKDDVREVFLI